MLNLNLGLKLREEFRGHNMPGTVVELHQTNNKGALDRSAQEFLDITYPTNDVIRLLQTVREGREDGNILLMAERGHGKSHLLAVLHHALEHPDAAEEWLNHWSSALGDPTLKDLKLAQGFMPITEALHNNEYSNLWDILFDQHPKGEYYRGKCEEKIRAGLVPPRKMLEEMFEAQPTCLILDEFQTWFDNLSDIQGGIHHRSQAFNIIQNFSEIARDRHDIFMFVVSLRNNDSEAFKQIHRTRHVIIDFKGEKAKEDRRNLILHRLFENRRQIDSSEIEKITASYADERVRLNEQLQGKNPIEIKEEVKESWPFAPELLALMEDQILMASGAQQTRDMIRILAMVYKTKGTTRPLITSADFNVEDSTSEVQALIDSITQETGQDKLRDVAKRNLEEITNTGADVPYKSGMVSAIWMHSMVPGNTQGIKRNDLHLAISADGKVDDNTFNAQLSNLLDSSVNIHYNQRTQRYRFELGENPRTKVRNCAKNDRMWAPDAEPNQTNYPGKDIEWIKRTLEGCLIGETTAPPLSVIVLGPHWETDPWSDVQEKDKPDRWNQPVLIVMPCPSSENMNQLLGRWLKQHVKNRRNLVRFLIQEKGKGIYEDRDLRIQARCSWLCSREGWGGEQEYRNIQSDFDNELRQNLKDRFKKYAVLQKWDYQDTHNCVFDLERIESCDTRLAENVAASIKQKLFDASVFDRRVLDAAQNSQTLGGLIKQMAEPEAGDVTVFLGPQGSLDLVCKLAAKGKIAININESWYIKRADQSEESALKEVQQAASKFGSSYDSIRLGLPDAAAGASVIDTNRAGQNVSPTTAPSNSSKPSHSNGGAVPAARTGNSSQTDPPDELLPVSPVPTLITQNMGQINGTTVHEKFEKWGLNDSQILRNASLEISGISVAELKTLIMRTPSRYPIALNITYEGESDK